MRCPPAVFLLFALGACAEPSPQLSPEMERLMALVLPADDSPPPDVTNAVADDPRAAAFGQRLFFDPRFSGPLLDDANTGIEGTLGVMGEAGRVSCASCHVPDNGSFVDTRSSRGQLSLASSWTPRRTPALLDIASTRSFTWDGRHDTVFAVVFDVIESPIEFNSSRLFVAQQLARFHREEYEAVFGPMPSLAAYDDVAASEAGCTELPLDPTVERCPGPGHDDPAVIEIVANMGKALHAYMRRLTCGPSRFDAWMSGDLDALTEDEIAGARLFVGRGGCDGCHAGPRLTDNRFYNVGAPGGFVPFTGVDTSSDPGAMVGLAAVRTDVLGSRGPFSDGDDGRLDALPGDPSAYEGAFRTPSLRCIESRPSYLHNAELRSLYDVVDLFIEGGAAHGYRGRPDIQPLDLTREERDQLVAFLRALEGPGPELALRAPP